MNVTEGKEMQKKAVLFSGTIHSHSLRLNNIQQEKILQEWMKWRQANTPDNEKNLTEIHSFDDW